MLPYWALFIGCIPQEVIFAKQLSGKLAAQNECSALGRCTLFLQEAPVDR